MDNKQSCNDLVLIGQHQRDFRLSILYSLQNEIVK